MKLPRLLAALAWVFLIGAGYSAYRWFRPAPQSFPSGPPVAAPVHRSTVPDTSRAYPDILVDARWLRDHLASPGVVVVDGRSPGRFAAGHVPGSVRLDAGTWDGNPWSLAGWLGAAGVPAEGTVVAVSDSVEAPSSGLVFWLLELAGQRKARVLAGGLDAWKQAGGPLERGHPPVAPRPFAARPDTSLLADARYVTAASGRIGTTILDPRSEEAWAAGHIPHSLPFSLDFRLDGREAAGPVIRLAFQNWGPRDNDYIHLDDEIVIGGDVPPGARVHPYLAARLAGLEKIRVYPEGFAGWKARGDLPVVRLVSTRELRDRLHAEGGPELPDRRPRGFILFDLRESMDFERGHIPGATLLRSDDFADSLETVVARFWPDARRETTPLIVYCYGPQCVRSRNCTTIAAHHGYRVLEWYREGTDGWQRANETVARGNAWAPKSLGHGS